MKAVQYGDLPIKKYKKQILYAVESSDVTILIAETGIGKTTQIPQFLIQGGYALEKRIGVVLPRRIACTTICRRVCTQLGCHNGEIAYNIRFHSTVNQNTRVKFMTDGMAVQELYSDPLLSEYSVIMLDDIHQRSVSTDMLLGFLKKIMYKRNDLKIILCSATLDGDQLKKYFEFHTNIQQEKIFKVEIINLVGRTYPVDLFYLTQPSKNYILKAFQTVVTIDQQKSKGDVLVFLTSQEEIQAMASLLDNYKVSHKRHLKILQLYSSLDQAKQEEVFDSCYDRKVILSTNIAESSITLDGLQYVVDTGFVKIKVFDNERGAQTLMIVPCGKMSAKQRMGRAGRVKQGQCYRLYTQEGYDAMPERLAPQMLRVDLSSMILKLKGLGVGDIMAFEMLDTPKEYSIVKALECLHVYGLMDLNAELTPLGSRAAELSFDIKAATMILHSFDPKFGCSQEITILASMLAVEKNIFGGGVSPLSILKTKKKVGAKEGDFVSLVNIFLRYRNAKTNEKRKFCADHKVDPNTMEQVIKIHSHLVSQLKGFNRYKSVEEELEDKFGGGVDRVRFELKSSHDDIEPILRCILSGYFTQIAQLQGDGTYRNIRSKETLHIHQSSIVSVVYPQWIVYLEIVKNTKYVLYNASKIDPEWLFQLAGHFYKDARKQIADNKFGSQLNQLQALPQKQQQDKKISLVRIGQAKKSESGFKTGVLGLKSKGLRNTSLSFEDQL